MFMQVTFPDQFFVTDRADKFSLPAAFVMLVAVQRAFVHIAAPAMYARKGLLLRGGKLDVQRET